MRPLKTSGLEELKRLRSRGRRQLALGRILKDDWEFIDRRLDDVEARIVSMKETDENGEEV
jgi:hypothetical protein